MAFNVTTDQQNAKYAQEFEIDLEDFMELFKSIINDKINEAIKNNGGITIEELENIIVGLVDGDKEFN